MNQVLDPPTRAIAAALARPGHKKPPHSRALFIAIIAGSVLVCAALLVIFMTGGHGLAGTYNATDGNGRLEFKGSRVYVTTALGTTFVSAYEVDGDHVIIKGAGGAQVYTRHGETLDGGLGIRFVKQ